MDPLLLRFIERIIAVLIGGSAVYFGYRLFLSMPEQRNGTGKFVLPWDISIAISRVGPGVFFALFGVATVCLALARPIEVGAPVLQLADGQDQRLSFRYMGGAALDDPTARADARALLRREIALLNTIPQLLPAEFPEHDRDDIERGIARIKLALMTPVWGTPQEGFGDVSAFAHWIREREPDPPPAGMEGALALYRYGGGTP
ncbi:MAG TPA: hypothetical protein VNP04_22890 [Alphaproteobacteria bacterium]|nr:hypothetical protein [Alphaproteobacteria bacterium]